MTGHSFEPNICRNHLQSRHPNHRLGGKIYFRRRQRRADDRFLYFLLVVPPFVQWAFIDGLVGQFQQGLRRV